MLPLNAYFWERITNNGHKLFRELVGLGFLFCGLLILLSLWTYHIEDPTLNQTVSGSYVVKNAAGVFGAYLSGFLTDFFGFLAFIWPLFFLVMGSRLLSAWFVVPWWRWIGYVLMCFCAITAAEAWRFGIGDVRAGGMLGSWLYAEGHRLFSPGGFSLIWIFLFLAAVELGLGISWLSALKQAAVMVARGLSRLAAMPRPNLPPLALPDLDGLKGRLKKKDKEGPILDLIPLPVGAEESPVKHTEKSQENTSEKKEAVEKKDAGEKKENGEKKGLFGKIRAEKSRLPSLDLLAPPPRQESQPQDDLQAKGQALMNCLQDFDIKGELARITPGPVVTMFEVRPAPGVKVSRIARLSADMAMALKAVAVRIQAPIPGSDTVGVEIPNARRAMVSFRELLEGENFRKARPEQLSMALGKDIGGRPMTADLARMPHLLVAGATGAGKSVCLNSIIISLLYKCGPDELKMLLVDPKRVELSAYADLPHLVHPVVTEMDLAKNALLWAIDEMERRYELLRLAQVRNITDFNARIITLNPRPEGLEDAEVLPYMVIIVDELADLMISKGKDVESSIVRLAQLARAAGIHLIIATQRPSVDVVTGLIKANFPSRISFQVTSPHDSRTILDSVGAETLLGKGDMLYKPNGGKLMRLHGAFVSDEEVAAVVDHWKRMRKPDYQVNFAEYANESAAAAASGTGSSSDPSSDIIDDPIYAEAVQFVREQGKVSISLLQRRFRVGFNRAARYVEQMEKDGLLSPGDNTKPRTVLK